MTTKRKHVYRKPDPRNADLVRVYFRHPKTGKLDPLTREEESSEFAEQYDALFAALTAAPPTDREPNVRVARNRDNGNVLYPPATLGWFAENFLASKYFDTDHKDAYAEGTRYNYRKTLDLLKARLGGGLLVDLDQEAVEIYSAEVAREHGDSAGDDQISMISTCGSSPRALRSSSARGGSIQPRALPGTTNTTARVISFGPRKSSSGSITTPRRGCNLCGSGCTTPVSAAAMSSG